MYLSSCKIIKFGGLIALVSTIWWAQQVMSLRTATRSVMQCDMKTSKNEWFTSPKSCETHCEYSYVHVNSKIYDANVRLAEYQLKQHPRGPNLMCCCSFNSPWPEMVKMSSVGVGARGEHKATTQYDCLPLTFAINLSSRTRKDYETLCRFLRKTEPLTMLELRQFASAAAYLNLQQPRHPFIMKTLQMVEVKKIDRVALNELLFKEVQETFMDYLGPVERYDGLMDGNYMIRKMQSLRKTTLKTAVKSKVVAEALDEYMESYAMVDMASAAIMIADMNRKLDIPPNLVADQYDKYSIDKTIYFSKSNLDCRQIREINGKLTVYLSTMKDILNNLYEKLVYDYMSRHYNHLKFLIHMSKIYKELIDFNCKR